MNVGTTEHGFQYVEIGDNGITHPLVVQESALVDGDSAFCRTHPGSSFLWFGTGPNSDRAHLNREQVEDLRDALTTWLETGDLNV